MLTHIRGLAVVFLAGVPRFATAQDSARPVAYYNPAWSPDSRTIAFESNRDGRYAIYTMVIETRRITRLTSIEVEASQPSWSPDGSRIVFGQGREGGSDLYLMNPDGSNPARLTTAPGSHFFASYSPDGRWIVFGKQDPRRRELYYAGIVQADGTGYLVLTDSTASSEGPRWSPDGERIIFTRTPLLARDPGESMRDLARRRQRASTRVSIHPDGSEAREEIGAPEGEGVEEPVDSPDGRFAVYAKEVNGSAGLYLIEKATGQERLLVGGSAPRQ